MLTSSEWPFLPGSPVGYFQAEAMGSSAYHLCDKAWATGVHSFPGYDNVTGFAPLTIDFSQWTGDPHSVKVSLPEVDANETEQEITGGPPATLHVQWMGTYTIANESASQLSPPPATEDANAS